MPVLLCRERLVRKAGRPAREALFEHAIDPEPKLAVAAADGEVGRFREDKVRVSAGPGERADRGPDAEVVFGEWGRFPQQTARAAGSE